MTNKLVNEITQNHRMLLDISKYLVNKDSSNCEQLLNDIHSFSKPKNIMDIVFADDKYTINHSDSPEVKSAKKKFLLRSTDKLLAYDNKVLDWPVNSEKNYIRKNDTINDLEYQFLSISEDFNVENDDDFCGAYGEHCFLMDIEDNPVLVSNVRSDMELGDIPHIEPKWISTAHQK